MDQGGPIPFAMELFQKGILTKENCDGLELKWGNELAVLEILRKIAYREGIGDILAEGSVRAAKKIGKGAEKSVMAIKGMEMFGRDPRTAPMLDTLSLLTCLRGADEQLSTSGIPFSFPGWAKNASWSKDEYLRWLIDYLDMFDDVKEAVFGVPPSVETFDASSIKGKAALTKWFGDLISVCDSLGLCLIAVNMWPTIGPTISAKLYSALVGWQISPQELMKTGERIHNLIKAYLVREGLSRKDDSLPARFYEEPISDGPAKGALLSKDKMNRLLEEYYDVRGWDRQTGVPGRKKLIELGLDYVANELCRLGLITD
jgi:aldehyde:ferredoxin oxidoreductase